MFHKYLSIFIVTASILQNGFSFPGFRANIPNGDKVRNPCEPTSLWPGVGHWNRDGGGDRNPFGKQFEANNYQWTVLLCQADSDGDGLTNGQEMGDPNCVWTSGKQPLFQTNISHPGICEPVTSMMCKLKNTNLNCKPPVACPLLQEPGVKNITLKFDNTKIPAQDTNYFCKVFRFPTDRLYDMIATQPIVDNKLVVHHMQLYGCENDNNLPHTDGVAFPCSMGIPGFCTSILALWSLGADGDCLTEQYGYRIGTNSATGKSGYRYAALEIHWTNYDHLTNQFDSSGLNIFYTPNLRPNKAAILQLGQYDLNIPPNMKEFVQEAKCSSTCSKKVLLTPVKISQATVHAHLLAKKGSIELHRDGKLLRYILNDYPIDFNFPKMFLIEPPIEYLPGDAIKVNCFYDSTGRTTATVYGDGTRDEMCIGYFVYYPAQEPVAFTNCGQWKNVSLCNDVEERTCDAALLSSYTRPITASCTSGCPSSCKSAVDAMLQNECGTDAMITELGKNDANFPILDAIDRCLIAKNRAKLFNKAKSAAKTAAKAASKSAAKAASKAASKAAAKAAFKAAAKEAEELEAARYSKEIKNEIRNEKIMDMLGRDENIYDEKEDSNSDVFEDIY